MKSSDSPLKELDFVLFMFLHKPQVTEIINTKTRQRNLFLNDSWKETTGALFNWKILKKVVWGVFFSALIFLLYVPSVCFCTFLNFNDLNSIKFYHQEAKADILHICKFSFESNH